MENLCVQKANETTMGTCELNFDNQSKDLSPALSPVLELKTDREYLDAYFAICRLYQQKRRIIFNSDNKPVENVIDGEGDIESKEDRKMDVRELNCLIKESERKFDEAVRAVLDKKRPFMFEKMAAHYELSDFEKKIYLFFLYLEYHEIEKNMCFEDELLKIFDIEDSVYSRIQNARYFAGKANLFKEDILCRSMCSNNEDSARILISIDCKGTSLAAEVFSGIWKLEENSQESDDSDTRVGYIKEAGYAFDDVKLESEVKEKICLFLDFAKQKKLEKLSITDKIKKGLGTT
ncbi:MAG: hypothetical protein EOM23_11035, partial [Candidatus Moranbacteria bacterium]|nr:hypothetical protein [Candidatus Moranbacteria bacterium]